VAGGLPSASLLENVRLNALVIVPNAIQGIFRRRRTAVAAATRAGVDGHAVGLLRGMKRGHSAGPVWVRVVREPALLLLAAADVRRALQGSPYPFAPDPEAKRRGMSSFQPDALTISRGELWENRRRFTEAVLDTGQPHHRLAHRFLAVVREETASMLEEAEEAGGGWIRWDPFNSLLRRITRRVILGDGARDDEEVSELLGKMMDGANSLPDGPSEHLEPFGARIGGYIEAAEEGSLVGLFGQAPSDEETSPAGQVTHWLFALGDTLPINAFRTLALLATHQQQRGRAEEELAAAGPDGLATAAGVAGLAYLRACLEEAMRLWPTTPLLSRETLEETSWNGHTVPAGTQVLIVNTFNHRDRDSHEFADRFAPEAWTEGDAAEDWSFNHFSHGPQGCPGAGLALFVGVAVLAELLSRRRFRLEGASLDPARPLPHMLDHFGLRFAVEAR
jgi:cytochrome P450